MKELRAEAGAIAPTTGVQATIRSGVDSSRTPSSVDSSRTPSSVDSSRGPSSVDSSRGPSSVDSSRAPSSQVKPVVYPGAVFPFVLERLTKALGATRASEVMNERLALWRPRALETAQDLLDFSNHIMRCGGLVQAVGRSLKVQALLRGAME